MNQIKNKQSLNYLEMQKILSLHIWKNGHLRKEILNNPKATIERDLKVRFGDDVEVNVISHDDSNEVTFILPAAQNQKQELSEEELDQVAGGLTSPQRTGLMFLGPVAWVVLGATKNLPGQNIR